MNDRKRQIDSYNAFRGICAVGILFSHMFYLSNASNPFWKYLYDHFMRYGSRCTSFFFIMSGFLLAYTWKDIEFGKYIKGKLKRLYPLTLCVLILAIGCSFFLNDMVNGDMPVGSLLWLLSIILNLVLLKAFVPIESVFYSFHGPSWYISVLIIFYVVGYFVVKENNKGTHRRKLLIESISIVYIIEFVLCIMIDTKELSDLRLYLTYVNPYFRIFGEGMLGVLLCVYMPQIQLRIAKWDKNVLEIGALVTFFGFFIANNFVSSSIWSAWVWFIPVSSVIIAFYQDEGIVSGIFKSSFWQFLGNISFEMYMTHAFVYEGIPVAVGIVSKTLKSWIIYHSGTRFLITLIVSVVLAEIVHILFNFKKVNKK